ncbi:hypothetical protein ARMA_1717 [Ardenticatena maritima]|uniref:Uncharacterized protein n=1 Tax=Ardenticatena maritima TaxID=872965 RepID=A0A0M9UCT2_9CHLR|nr:hypothetical protein [Ardenticatena maritima]KPL89151.1 hypothetical protein SE16_01140 [Ardenticatena maritima]GAP63294.1 hypothetical protein ARMA_1717 [Ardenticatena maritima]
MSRLISTHGSPTTQRNRLRRTIAEALRTLMQKQTLDEETRDLAALIWFSLRALEANIDQSASAWEKRNYYIKADRFRAQWEWLTPMQRRLERILREELWELLPPLLADLSRYFDDITVNRRTRSKALWQGAYQRFLEEMRK